MACAAPLPPPPPPRRRAACDVRAPSCPPLSFFTSVTLIPPPPSLSPSLRCGSPPRSLSPLTYLHLLHPHPILSVYLVHLLILPSFCQKPYFHARSFHPPLPPYNFSCVCQHPPCSLSLTFYTPPRTARARVCVCMRLQPALSVLPTSPWAWFFSPSARLLHQNIF